MDGESGSSHISQVNRLGLLLCVLVVASRPLAGQAMPRVDVNARLRVWSQNHALRAAEGRLVERWGDTLVVAIRRDDSFEPVRELVVLPAADIDSLETWAASTGGRRSARNRLFLIAGIGGAIVAGSAGGLYSLSEALFSAGFVTLFVAVGSSAAPDGAWRAVDLPAAAATAPVPAAPDR